MSSADLQYWWMCNQFTDMHSQHSSRLVCARRGPNLSIQHSFFSPDFSRQWTMNLKPALCEFGQSKDLGFGACVTISNLPVGKCFAGTCACLGDSSASFEKCLKMAVLNDKAEASPSDQRYALCASMLYARHSICWPIWNETRELISVALLRSQYLETFPNRSVRWVHYYHVYANSTTKGVRPSKFSCPLLHAPTSQYTGPSVYTYLHSPAPSSPVFLQALWRSRRLKLAQAEKHLPGCSGYRWSTSATTPLHPILNPEIHCLP